jgi:Zn-dependent M28 family amino/carboxypeptidase
MNLPFYPLLVLTTAALAATPDYIAEGNRWWSHIQVLADDKMEGRNTGSEGHRKAATYVAGEFERAGLKPGGTNGYIQPVKFDVKQIVEEKCSLVLERDGKPEPLKLGEDAVISLRADTAADVNAPLVFIGHGLVIPERGINDLAGLDLQGKVVVLLAGGPQSIPSALKAHYSSGGERWKPLKAAGALGVITIPNPKSMDIPWERSSLARFQPSMSVADPKLDETQGLLLAVMMNPAHADKLLAGTGHTISEILALADASSPLPHFAIPASIQAHVSLKRSQVESQNVAGILEGSDPALKSQYVVLSAHLDHVGVGQPINGDKIYNGAMDDASGVASLIEIAQQLKAASARLKRSVLFVAVTGEEKGLQGSKYFAKYPTVPARSIIADINMDMYLPLFPLKYLEVQGLDESTLGEQIRAVCKDFGIEVQADKEPNRNLFIRSDQYSFIRQGIPALAFKFGYEAGSPQEKIAKAWLKERYHAPSDDLAQPVDKPAAAEFNRVLLNLTERVANGPQRPLWYKSSFFRRFAQPLDSGRL